MLKSTNFLFLLLIVVATTSCRRNFFQKSASESKVNIISGSKPAPDHPASWSSVALVHDASHATHPLRSFCSGTVVADNLILTASHCFKNLNLDNFRILFGESDQDKAAIYRVPDEFQVMKPDDLYYPAGDFAWVKFTGGLPKGYKAIEVLNRSKSIPKNLTLAGFGLTAVDCNISDTKCVGSRAILETSFVKYHDDKRFSGLIEIKPLENQGACSGDSGGPVYASTNGQWYLAGAAGGFDKILTPQAYKAGERLQCDKSTVLYSFAGNATAWIEKSSGVKLAFDKNLNPRNGIEPKTATVAKKATFEDWCRESDISEPGWQTVQQLLYDLHTVPFKDENSANAAYEDFHDCKKSQELLTSQGVGGKTLIISGAASDADLVKAKGSPILTLEPIAGLKDIENLKITNHRNGNDFDFSLLAQMPKLKELSIDNSRVKNADWLKFFSSNTTLEKLSLSGNFLEALPRDISLPNLKYLDVSKNRISDFSVLESWNVPKLQTLEFERRPRSSEEWCRNPGAARRTLDALMAVAEVSDCEEMFSLLARRGEIRITGQGLSDIGPLAIFTQLETLALNQNEIVDVQPLSSLINLRSLSLDGNPIEDISPLKTLENLEIFTLKDGHLLSFQGLEKMKKLSGLDFSLQNELLGKQARSLAPLAGLMSLRDLILSQVSTDSIDALTGLKNLTNLDVSRNRIRDLSPLKKNVGLKRLNATANPLQVKECPVKGIECLLPDGQKLEK